MKQLAKLVWSATAAFALVIAMGATSPAAAQAQIAAGYQFVNSSAGGSSTSAPAGWFADVNIPLANPMLGVVISVDGSYKTETFPIIGDVTSKTHGFMGGVRYSLPASGMLTPFVQFMGGAANLSSSAGGTSASETKGAFDIGGGINFGLNENLALRVGVDYRRIMSDPGLNQIRITAGVAF